MNTCMLPQDDRKAYVNAALLLTSRQMPDYVWNVASYMNISVKISRASK